jgi:tetratricopeptide (TPR) repeat protein/predicted Ser/Thr protein kinase
VTGTCPFCAREGVEMDGAGDVQFCRACAALIDVPAALRHLPDAPDEGGGRLGRYEIVRELGRGVSGVVYEVRDSDLQRRVALKVLDAARMGADPMRRFLREGRLLAKIRHPNVVQIHELGSDGGKVFIAMEFVDGVPFPGSADREEGIRRLAVVARALDHVHRQGIIHRDLKPSNILVERSGRPVLMDFGVARGDDGGTTSGTATGAVLGTPGYMAPEQLLGNIRDVDARSDVYALGVLLFELVTGRLPVGGASVVEYAERLKSSPPPPLRSLRPEVSRALDDVCRRALAAEKEGRPPSAGAFAAALTDTKTAAPSLLRRFAFQLAAALAIAALGAAVTVWAARSRSADSPPAATGGEGNATTTAWVEEAAGRRARAHSGTLSFDAAIVEMFAAEALYQRAIKVDPECTAATVGLGRLYSDLGRAAEAHREFDRVLAKDPSNLEILRAKGNLIVTAQLLILFDRKSFPKVSKALAERLAGTQGRSLEDLLKRLPSSGAAASLARTYAAVARSEFEEAKRLAAQIPSSEETPFLDLAIEALLEQGRPASGALGRGDDEALPPKREPAVWIALIRHLDRRQPRFRLPPAPASTRTRVDSVLLRLEAATWELRGDRTRAAEAYAHSVSAGPDYLQSRLHYAKLLKELGENERAAREVEAAERSASALGLGAAAAQEIRSGP